MTTVWTLKFILALMWLVVLQPGLATAHSLVSEMQLRRVRNDDQAELMFRGKIVSLHIGERLDVWTLVEVLPAARAGESERAVFEDYTRMDGDLIFLDATGHHFALPKSAEPTSADPKTLYLGHSREEILNSETDLLAKAILAKPGDPSYQQVASVFEPLRKMPTYSFVGTPDSADKVGLEYGGRSPNFDPAPYDPAINAIREQGKVLDGLVGGYLPILRFVYPQDKSLIVYFEWEALKRCGIWSLATTKPLPVSVRRWFESSLCTQTRVGLA